MHTSQRISKFYDDLNNLELKFPGKELSKMGYSKGYVSDVINKKKEPSEDFLKDFYKKFSIGSQSNTEMTDNVLPLGNLRITVQDYLDLLREQTRKAEEREKEYLEIIKSKLISIDASSKELADDISALTSENLAAHRALMDSVDVAAKQPIGTTREAAGIVEIASEKARVGKGMKDQAGVGKTSK